MPTPETVRECRSCGLSWPVRAFRRWYWFDATRCSVCRRSGRDMARLIHWLAFPFGVPDAD